MLRVEQLRVRYRAIAALRGVSLEVLEGEAVGIVGPNGAGKSSLLMAIAGAVAIESGTVEFAGRPLNGLAPERIIHAGIAIVSSGRRVFPGLTVEENLRLGEFQRRERQDFSGELRRLYEAFPVLGERRHSPADRLSGGEQQQLAIARALLGRPRLLMLDEPSLGLAPLLVDKVYEILRRLRADGTTMLVVEQNPARLMDFVDRLYVLNDGLVSISGRTSDVLTHRHLESALFGLAAADDR